MSSSRPSRNKIKAKGFKREVKNPRFRSVKEYEMPEIRASKFRKWKREAEYRAKVISFIFRNRRLFMQLKELIVSFGDNRKQNFILMLTWLKDRLSEPSTHRSIIGFASVVGVTINPELVNEIMAFAVSLLSFIEFIRKERK